MSRRLFIAGCGYTGGRVATGAAEAGWRVTAHLRSGDRADILEKAGIRTILCSMDEPEQIPLLELAGQVLLYSIPPQGGGNIDLRLRNFCATLERDNSHPARIIYLGAATVYGDTGGATVRENDDTKPASAMGKRRLDAETVLTEFAAARNIPLVIVRIPAIYGKGRLPLMQISQGQPLLHQELTRPASRIHVDDLVQICLKLLEDGEGIYNVADENPTSMTEYFNACADALELPRQPLVDLEEGGRVMPPLLYNYFMESRTVDNSRMLQELQIKLKYPEMLSGIAASV